MQSLSLCIFDVFYFSKIFLVCQDTVFSVYNYKTVQNEVNRLLKNPNPKTINDVAKEVRLENTGYNYAEVQAESK